MTSANVKKSAQGNREILSEDKQYRRKTNIISYLGLFLPNLLFRACWYVVFDALTTLVFQIPSIEQRGRKRLLPAHHAHFWSPWIGRRPFLEARSRRIW